MMRTLRILAILLLSATAAEAQNITTFSPLPIAHQNDSIVVCRGRKCQTTRTFMSEASVNNILYNLLNNNVGLDASICEADSVSNRCLQNHISFLALSGVTPITVSMNAVRVLDVRPDLKRNALYTLLDYNLLMNGRKVFCTPSQTGVVMRGAENVAFESAGFWCPMNYKQQSAVTILYHVAYIDLDYGLLGTYYSVGVNGMTVGGGKGYMLMQFRQSSMASLLSHPWYAPEMDRALSERLSQPLGEAAPLTNLGQEVYTPPDVLPGVLAYPAVPAGMPMVSTYPARMSGAPAGGYSTPIAVVPKTPKVLPLVDQGTVMSPGPSGAPTPASWGPVPTPAPQAQPYFSGDYMELDKLPLGGGS